MKLTEITPDGKFCYGALNLQNHGFTRIVDSAWQSMFPDSIHSAGIRIRFATNSQSVALRFSVETYEYSFVTGLSMYLGVQYVVRRSSPQKSVVKREVAVAKSAHEEVYVQIAKFATKGTKYFYEIYLPPYAQIERLAIETDDDCDIEPYGYGNDGKLLFLGGPLSKGMGCTFPSATFSQAVCAKLDTDFCNLAVSQYSFPYARLTEAFPFAPRAVITEGTAAGMSKVTAEEKTEKYLRMLLDVFPNVPIVVLSQPFWGDKTNFYAEKRQALETSLQTLRKEYPTRLFHIDGEKMFEYSRYDEYTLSLYNMNDNYNMLLAEKLKILLAENGIGGGVLVVMQILENVHSQSVYEHASDYTFFDIFERSEFLFGAPVKADRKLRKIASPEKLAAENGLEQDAAFLVANAQTSGVRLRFFTDSPDVLIKVRTGRAYPHQKMTMACSSGFDLYFVNNGVHTHVTVIAQDFGETVFAHKFDLYNKPRNVELFFPLYNTVEEMLVGVRSGSRLEPSRTFSAGGSLIFYGNSRTQGASASRSGNAYPNVLSRILDCDIVNYSFSAACRAEESMARQIIENNRAENRNVAGVVIDYNNNAKDVEELSSRYSKFYEILRSEYAKCPIVLIGAFGRKDFDVFIKEFHDKCKLEGDKTFYVNLHALFADLDDFALTTDDLHYSDNAMFLLANKIGEYFRQSSADFQTK